MLPERVFGLMTGGICVASVLSWVCLSGCEFPRLRGKVEIEKGGGRAVLLDYTALKPGTVFRYKIQSSLLGPGVLTVEVAGRPDSCGMKAFRLCGSHRYENGRVFYEEEFLSVGDNAVIVPARLSTGGGFGSYKPPLKKLVFPLRAGHSWKGSSVLDETGGKAGKTTAARLDWQGSVECFETVSVPAGRFTSCVKVFFDVDHKYRTIDWYAPGRGLVRREIRCEGELRVFQELLP